MISIGSLSRASRPLLLIAIGLLLVSTTNGSSQGGLAFPAQKINNVQISQVGPQPDFQMQIVPNQFLMMGDTRDSISIIFTPINNFSGIVNLSGSISPTRASSPTISLPAIAKVNWTISGIPHYFMIVNTTTATTLGLYTITVYGVSAQLSHTAIVQVGVTNVPVPSNGAEMIYEGNFTTVSYAGSSTDLNNTFEDLGYLPIGVRGLTIETSFGTVYTDGDPSCDQYCLGVHPWLALVAPFTETTTPYTFQIPASISPGNYSVTITISWALQPGTPYQTAGPYLVTHGSLIVYPYRLVTSSWWIPVMIIGGVAGVAVLVTVLLLWKNNRRIETQEMQRIVQGASQPSGIGITKTCPRCGAISLEPKFCDECGLKLS